MSAMRQYDDPRIETGKAALSLAEHEAAFGPGDAPRLGDVYLFNETDVDGLEWAVVDLEPGGRFLVVPLDDHPFVGSRDLELPIEALGGAACLRGGLEVWLNADRFDPEMRTGRLPDDELERVRQKRREIHEGQGSVSLRAEEVDGDPVYLRWRETLEEARNTLRSVEEAMSSRPGEVIELSPHRTSTFIRTWAPSLALAATVVVAIGLGLYSQHLQDSLADESRRAAELEAQSEAQREQMEDQQQQLEVQQERIDISAEEARAWEVAYQELEAHSGGIHTSQQERIAELEGALGAARKGTAQVNALRVRVEEKATRTREGMIEVFLGPDDRLFLLDVQVANPEPYERYRLRIVPGDGSEAIFESDEMVKKDGRFLRSILSTDLFPVGEYEILVDGLNGDVATPLEIDGGGLKIERGFGG